MRLKLFAVLLCCSTIGAVSLPRSAAAQTAPAPAQAPVSPPAKAEVTLGSGSVTIDYSAPSARGRVIFGSLVPYDHWWRTGANPATTLKTSTALKIGDLDLPAGTYTLYTLPSASSWQLIVNKQTGQWGTVYDQAQDLGRVPMTVGSNASPVETMVIDFEKTSGSSTELHVKWVGVDASVKVTAK